MGAGVGGWRGRTRREWRFGGWRKQTSGSGSQETCGPVANRWSQAAQTGAGWGAALTHMWVVVWPASTNPNCFPPPPYCCPTDPLALLVLRTTYSWEASEARHRTAPRRTRPQPRPPTWADLTMAAHAARTTSPSSQWWWHWPGHGAPCVLSRNASAPGKSWVTRTSLRGAEKGARAEARAAGAQAVRGNRVPKAPEVAGQGAGGQHQRQTATPNALQLKQLQFGGGCTLAYLLLHWKTVVVSAASPSHHRPPPLTYNANYTT